MNNKTVQIFLVLFFVSTLMVACASPAPAEPTVAVDLENDMPGSEDASDASQSENLGACDNVFFPLDAERTMVYQFESSQGSGEYQMRFTDIRSDGFTSVLAIEDSSVEIDWTCTEGGLVSSEFSNFSLIDSPEFNVKTLDVSGILLPDADLMVEGYRWDISYTVEVEIPSLGSDATFEGEIQMTNTLTTIESVTVPIGTYDQAYRVDSEGVLTMTAFGVENEVPMGNTNWYVRDVGLVKSVADIENQAYEMVLVAVIQ